MYIVAFSQHINHFLSFFFFYCRIHSWGDSLEEAFEQCAMGMFGYMTDTETVEPTDTLDVESEGRTQDSACFFLNHLELQDSTILNLK